MTSAYSNANQTSLEQLPRQVGRVARLHKRKEEKKKGKKQKQSFGTSCGLEKINNGGWKADKSAAFQCDTPSAAMCRTINDMHVPLSVSPATLVCNVFQAVSSNSTGNYCLLFFFFSESVCHLHTSLVQTVQRMTSSVFLMLVLEYEVRISQKLILKRYNLQSFSVGPNMTEPIIVFWGETGQEKRGPELSWDQKKGSYC